MAGESLGFWDYSYLPQAKSTSRQTCTCPEEYGSAGSASLWLSVSRECEKMQ